MDGMERGRARVHHVRGGRESAVDVQHVRGRIICCDARAIVHFCPFYGANNGVD